MLEGFQVETLFSQGRRSFTYDTDLAKLMRQYQGDENFQGFVVGVRPITDRGIAHTLAILNDGSEWRLYGAQPSDIPTFLNRPIFSDHTADEAALADQIREKWLTGDLQRA